MRILVGVLACVLFGYDLPELPHVNTSSFLPVVRAQIERASAEARAHPRDANAVGSLAMTLHAYQLYDAAARAYERAHFLQPQNFDWLYLLGAVEMAQGQFDAAVKSYRAALRIRPGDPVTELRLADTLTSLANREEARALYRRILDDHPGLAQAWYGLGRVQAAQHEHAAAAQSYAKACELFPAFGMAHFALAGEMRRLGNNVEAEHHLATYRKNVTLEPPLDDPLFRRIHELNLGVQAHLQRAEELEKAGRLDEAIRETEAAQAIDPQDAQVRVNLISLYGRAGDLNKAKQQFESVIKLAPGRSDAWYDYGVLLFREQNYADAEKAFRRAIEINPSYAEAHNNLGAIYEQQGRLDDAANEFRKAIADRPDYPLARFHLGRILVNDQKYDEAIHQFSRALTPEDEETTAYLYALAATYARAGDRPHALAYFQKAHDAAVARGQQQLLISIDRDLRSLGAER